MKKFSVWLLASLLLLSVGGANSSNSQAEDNAVSLVVVVHSQNKIKSLSKKEIIDIYMGRFNTFPDGSPVAPIDLPSGSIEKQSFYQLLVGKDERKIKAYWSRLLFSGRATPPSQAESKLDLIKSVDKHSLAYLPLNEVTSEMKIVYQF